MTSTVFSSGTVITAPWLNDVNTTVYTTVPNNTAAIASQSNASGVAYTPAGTGAVATTVQAKLRQYISVFDFMTSAQIADVQANTALVDVTAAIQAAITASNDVYFPAGTYSVDAQINLKSGLTLSGTPASIIKLASVVTPYVLRGDSLNNIVLENITILGNGLSGYSTVYLSNSSNVLVQNCKITKSGSNALWFVTCSFVKVENCELSNNYYYGLEFRDCDGCKAIANLCYGNGDTGVAVSAGGRGIMLWRTRGSYIAGNRLVANNEYGFRIYSEAADTYSSYGNVITGNYFQDNVRSDFVLYDESLTGSLVYRNVISDNIVVRSTNTTLGNVYTLHGGQNTFVNNHAYKNGAFGTDCAFLFYYNFDTTVIGCSAANFQQAFSFSGSERVTLQNCLGNGVAQAVTSELKNITIKNSKFIHSGTGTTDVAINNSATATGKNWFEGNYFDGFFIGIRIGDEAVALFRNTTVNCTTGLKKDGSVLTNLESGQNSWDVCDPSLLSSLNKTVSADNRKQLFYASYPTVLTWAVGDVVTNNAPAVGQPKGWMCTVAGTPGTWVSMGNL